MVHLRVVPVADVDGTVGAGLDVHRTEPFVVAGHRMADIQRLEGGPGRGELAQDHPALKGLHAEEFSLVSRRERRPAIDYEVVGEALDVVVGHLREVAEGIGIRQWAVLLESLLQIRALLVVEAAGVSAVVAGEDPRGVVHLAAEGVASSLAEDFKATGLRMIAPDLLSHGVRDGRLVEARSRDRGGHRASLCGVKPPIRSPTQGVDDRMGVLKPEARQMHHRISIRNIVVIGIRIEEQVGRV